MMVVFSLSALWWRRMRGLWKFPDGIDWLRGKLGLVLMGGAMLSKSLIQFSVDGWSVFPPYYLTWGQTMGGNEDNGGLLQKVPCMYCFIQCPQPCSRPLLTHTCTEDSWTLTGKSGQSLVRSLLFSPGSWCAQSFVCALQESVSPVLCNF